MQSDDGAVERLATVVLERLRDQLGAPALRYRRPPAALGGGKFSPVYAIELTPPPDSGTGSYVIRLVGSPEQARLEAGLHRAANAAGLRAPRVLMWESDSRDLDAGCLVMERFRGRSYL